MKAPAMAVAKRHQEAIDLYKNLMEEVKVRLNVITTGTSGTLAWALPAQIVKETCYLQLRMICELVALGCLVAHGDIEETTSLRKLWDANRIMEGLEKLHPDFFPLPIAQEQHKFGKGQHEMNVIDPRVRKDEFLKLYAECGGFLHKGSLKNLLKETRRQHVDFGDISAKAKKLDDLLSVHTVFLAGGDNVFICVLRNKEDNFNVQVAFAEKVASAEPEGPPNPTAGHKP